MTLLQKWLLILGGLGAAALVLSKPDAFYKAASGIRSVTAGSISDVTTQKSGA